MTGYDTKYGVCLCADSLDIIPKLKDNSINLILTSPPYSLALKKQYDNFVEIEQDHYVEWLIQFFKLCYSKLTDTGSIVVDLGGAYVKGSPVRHLYPYDFIIRMCRELGYYLIQDVYVYNTNRLPTPAPYVTVGNFRLKNSINFNLWFSRVQKPYADNRKVLTNYKKSTLYKMQTSSYEYNNTSPSGHFVHDTLLLNNGGAIPSDLIIASNSNSKDSYMITCKALGLDIHPARMSPDVCKFWIKFLTNEGDLVADIFSGSNIVGYYSEILKREWLSIDISPLYVSTSSFRFNSFKNSNEKNRIQYDKIKSGFISIVD